MSADLYLRNLHSLRRNDGKGNRACGYPRSSYVHCNSYIHDRWCEPYSSHHRHTSPPGQPSLSHDEEYALRKKLVNRALEALTTEVTGQTIFEV